MNRSSGRIRWLSQVLRSVAVVLAAAVGVFAAAPSPASLVTYAHNTVGYTYDGPALLSSPDTGATDARGSPSGREVGSWVSPVSVARDRGVAANTATEGYSSFAKAKTALGSPGPGNVYDHVVEQSHELPRV